MKIEKEQWLVRFKDKFLPERLRVALNLNGESIKVVALDLIEYIREEKERSYKLGRLKIRKEL